MEKFLNADPKPDAKAELLLRNNQARLLASLDELVDAFEKISLIRIFTALLSAVFRVLRLAPILIRCYSDFRPLFSGCRG